MIGDRVVARLPLRQGADAPAGKAFAGHQPVGDACRAIIGGKPAQQHMAGIGAAHPAGSLGAVERQGIGPEILEPEGGLEAPLQLPGQFLELAGFRRPAERRRHGAGAEIGGIGIGLDLGEGDGRLGQAAVVMHDGIGAVLPALVDEAVERLAVIFEKAVAIGIAETPHPAERRLDMRPDPPDELEVAGPLVIARGQQHEERRGIDAAVIMRERDLAQGRHFAAARLMQDLAGLGIGRRVGRDRLMGGEIAQGAGGEPRVEPQAFQGGDQPVAPEDRAEPGNAGIGIGAFRRLGGQHVEIGPRALQPAVEALIAAGELGRPGAALGDVALGRREAAGACRGRRPGR